MSDSNDAPTDKEKKIYVSAFSAIIVIILLAVVFRHSAIVRGIAFFIFGCPLAVAGWFVGRAVRNFARPDFVMTTDGFTGLVKIKLFWMFGPQLISVFVALLITDGIVNKIFPPALDRPSMISQWKAGDEERPSDFAAGINPPSIDAPSPEIQVPSVSSQGQPQTDVAPMPPTPTSAAPVAPTSPVAVAPLPDHSEKNPINDSNHQTPPADNGERNVQQDRANLLGTWHGYYICGQGETGTEVSLTEITEDGKVLGTFRFFNMPGMQNAVRGSYNVLGHYDFATKSLRLDPAGWIERPQGYTAVPILFPLANESEKLEGRILYAGCGAIVLSK
jgi:hypothetical protein